MDRHHPRHRRPPDPLPRPPAARRRQGRPRLPAALDQRRPPRRPRPALARLRHHPQGRPRPPARLGPRAPPRRARRHARPEARALRRLQPRRHPRQAGVPADRRHLPRPVARPRGGRPGLRRPGRRPSAASPPSSPQVAFERPITLDRPWTDFRGERHATMTGRPVAMHAMRGISAHSNGFQTCRALHLLQLLLGTVETPGGFRFEPPYPKPVALHPKPHHKVTPGYPLDGPPLGFPRGPEDLAIDADGRPKRIDKAFTWEAPLAVHGMLHTVIANAVAGRPLPDRGAVPLHGQHGLELGDEHRRDHGDADRHRRGRRVPHPEDHRRRQLLLRDRRLRRPGAARHHLPRAPRLHQPARPADLRARRRHRRDPLAGRRARAPGPRGRARLPVGAARPRAPPEAPRHGPPRRRARPTTTTSTT